MSIDLTKMPKLGFGLMRLPETDGKTWRFLRILDTAFRRIPPRSHDHSLPPLWWNRGGIFLPL